MTQKVQITEYLDIDLQNETWCCHRCGHKLISARKNYKEGCLVYERDPSEIYDPVIEGDMNFAPPSNWVKIIEFYCPECSIMIENELLPLGHPITRDLEIDIDKLKQKHSG